MDDLICDISEAKKLCDFAGSNKDFVASGSLVFWCLANKKIIRISPSKLSVESRNIYREFLLLSASEYLKKNIGIITWKQFATQKENVLTARLLHEFGVRGDLFKRFTRLTGDDNELIHNSMTISDVYELYCVRNGFSGTLHSFKRSIQKRYGSFAEFCILKGYDINNTKWVDQETALRVAHKLGSIEAISNRANGLLRYLEKNNLLGELIFDRIISIR